jgi:hypothetical protein
MLISKTCKICGRAFKVQPYRRNSARFCSGSCRATWVCSLPHNRKPRPQMLGNKFAAGNKPNRSSFKSGNRPWNAGKKGIHLSSASEFKLGRQSAAKVPIGTTRIRTTKREGVGRAYIKTAEPNIWKLRAVVVWESTNGTLPKGKLIHHKDRNPLNDAIDNLQCLTRTEHAIEHQHDLHEQRWPARAELSQRQMSRRSPQE